MSDRTYLQVQAYDCPEHQRDTVADILAQYVDDFEDGDDLDLTILYGGDQSPLGKACELAARLEFEAPAASFVLWEDPAYEHLGQIFAYAPALGSFSAESDANGEPQFSLSMVLAALDKRPGDPAASVLNWAMGKPWLDSWRPHRTDIAQEAGR